MKCLQKAYGCEDVERRGFVSLMDLYENNFIRIRKLIPGLKQNGQLCVATAYAVSRVDGCLDLHCHILEQTKYTTTFVLTYYFEEHSSLAPVYVAEPQLRCRAYHDAGLVEVLTGHLSHGRQCYDQLSATAIKIKWRLNRLLHKWLGYSLYSGHVFTCFEAQQIESGVSSIQQIIYI